jgi:L-ascorbate metabolism protein UlaG (beta-lactamase superfamily)
MRIRRLGWAGLELEAGGRIAVIDLLEDTGPLTRFIGEAHEPLPPPSAPGAVSLALVTHLHSDHADPPALARALAPDGVVLRPARSDGEGLETIAMAAAEQGFAQLQLPTRVVQPWETIDAGPFEVTAVPAADGFGDPQVSWVVAGEGRRIIHCGDTLFHGWWWTTRMRHGPFDAAFLPVNGPVVDLPHRQPHSTLPAAMDPRQAAEAAVLLDATEAVPIHYDALNNPPAYAQVERPAEAFAGAAERRGVRTRVVAPGDYVDLPDESRAAGLGAPRA